MLSVGGGPPAETPHTLRSIGSRMIQPLLRSKERSMHGLRGNRFLPSRQGFSLSLQWSRWVELLKTATVGKAGKQRQRSKQRGNGHSAAFVVTTAAARLTSGPASVGSSNRRHEMMRHKHIEINDISSAKTVAMS